MPLWRPEPFCRVPASQPGAASSPGPARSPGRRTAMRRRYSTRRTPSRLRSTSRRAVPKGKPVFLWNLVDLKRVRWEGPDALMPGKHTLEFDFKYDGLGIGTLAFNNLSGIGRGGTGVLKVDGKEVARHTMSALFR